MNKQQNIQNKSDWTNVSVDERLGKKLYVHDFRDKERLEVAPMGDEHEGSKFYERDQHYTILNWCLEKEVPVILMGDQMETATKESVGAGVYEQEEIVQEQLEKTVEKYKPLADAKLILGNHIGNHEARVYNSSGANLSKILAQMLNINYLGIGAAHYFMVGDQRYTMYTTHGSSGARMPHTKIANTIKMSSMIDVDIYAQGHLHQLSHHVQNYYSIDKSKRQVKESQKHYLICGSFLSHWGSYAQIATYEPARIGCPKIKLGGLERSIRVSL